MSERLYKINYWKKFKILKEVKSSYNCNQLKIKMKEVYNFQ